MFRNCARSYQRASLDDCYLKMFVEEGAKNIKGVTVLFVDNRATLINASLSKSIDFFDAL